MQVEVQWNLDYLDPFGHSLDAGIPDNEIVQITEVFSHQIYDA